MPALSKSFHALILQPVLDDPTASLSRARWPDQLKEPGWSPGTERQFLQRLCTYWSDQYDSRKFAQTLNELLRPGGRHFGAWERPDLLMQDLVAFRQLAGM